MRKIVRRVLGVGGAWALALGTAWAQGPVAPENSAEAAARFGVVITAPATSAPKPLVESVLPVYFDPLQGVAVADLIKLAAERNGELTIARLEVEKARARVRQAGARPNPVLAIEQTTGRLTGSAGERELSAGLAMPLEVYGQRGLRLTLARADVALKEAEFAARQRLVAGAILSQYAAALAALRELATLENLLALDTETTRFVQVRVNAGDTAPLELSLLQTEVERLRARRQLTEGRLQAAFAQLRLLVGASPDEPLRLREEINSARLPDAPATLEAAVTIALRERPEIRVGELETQLALNGLRLIRANSRPELAATARYSNSKSLIDSPRGAFVQRDQLLTFGLSTGLPVFNRNAGAKAEAEIAIRQAEARQIFTQQVITSEVAAAWQRRAAATRALATLETAVLPRARQNLATFQQVYALGELKITDLIAEQRRLLDAHRDVTETLTERYQAQADLLLALGVVFAPQEKPENE